MSLKEKLFDSKVSRRSFLKGMAAVGTTAALYGCGSGGDGAKSYEPVLGPSADLEFDRTVTEVWGTHPHNCGGRCPHKFFVKDYGKKTARIIKSTSAGDIPREGSLEKDESLELVQPRGCVRGFAQIKRTYSPDRLKYPLIQTKERGDVSGFKRATWDEALDLVAKNLADTVKRYKEYGGDLDYIPMVAGPGNGLKGGMMFAGAMLKGFSEGSGSGLIPYLGPAILPTGAPSTENLAYAQQACEGTGVGANSLLNYLESEVVINWGNDHSVKEPNKTFFMTKAKEAGIPIVTVDTMFTDTAAHFSTGCTVGGYTVPGFIQVRPQTDSALIVAMAYIIYNRKWEDSDYLKTYTYGFYPTQVIPGKDTLLDRTYDVQQPATFKGVFTPTGEVTESNKHFLLNQYSIGDELHVPAGWSFLEYLEKMGDDCFNKYPSSATREEAVIKWASELTGLSENLIENFAGVFAKAKHCFVDAGNAGGQKTNNGMHHCWLLKCLISMCGHYNKRGGNTGNNASTPSPLFYMLKSYPDLVDATFKGYILVNSNNFPKLIFTGRDDRTKEQFYNDMKNIYNIELDPEDPKLEIDMVLGGFHITNSVNTNPFSLGSIEALKSVKFYAIYEQYMTPTAVYADVILPAATHHEQPFISVGTATYYQNKLIEPMYDTLTDIDIDIKLAEKLGKYGIKINMSRNGKTDEELIKELWENPANTINLYGGLYPDMQIPSFDELKEKGYFMAPFPKSAATNPAERIEPGGFKTETGQFQFFSPYYYYRDGVDDEGEGKFRTRPRAEYVRPTEGYDEILENGGKVSGKDPNIKYTLQFLTKHARNRAHTVYDNVPMIKDQFDYPRQVELSPVDAAARGINDGDYIYVYNDYGCLKVKAKISNRILKGTVQLYHGNWFRASESETYKAYFSLDGGDPREYIVPVDVGGCENVLTHPSDLGPRDPLLGRVGDNHFNGNLCEVSKVKPE